jgi:hypothetical protein
MDPKKSAEAWAERLTIVFGLAAVEHGHLRTPVAEFHRLLVVLREAFPDLIPSFDEVGGGRFKHSEILSDALKRMRFDGRIAVSDDGRDLEIDRERAWRALGPVDALTRQRYKPVARRLVLLQQRDDRPLPDDDA